MSDGGRITPLLYPRAFCLRPDGVQTSIMIYKETPFKNRLDHIVDKASEEMRKAVKLAMRISSCDRAIRIVNASLSALNERSRLESKSPVTEMPLNDSLRKRQEGWWEKQNFYITVHESMKEYGYVDGDGDPHEIFIRKDVCLCVPCASRSLLQDSLIAAS